MGGLQYSDRTRRKTLDVDTTSPSPTHQSYTQELHGYQVPHQKEDAGCRPPPPPLTHGVTHRSYIENVYRT